MSLKFIENSERDIAWAKMGKINGHYLNMANKSGIQYMEKLFNNGLVVRYVNDHLMKEMNNLGRKHFC